MRHDSGYEGIYLELQQDMNKFLERQTSALEEIARALNNLGAQGKQMRDERIIESW